MSDNIVCDDCKSTMNVDPEYSIEYLDNNEPLFGHSIIVVEDGKCRQVKTVNSPEEDPYDDKLFGSILDGYVIPSDLCCYRTTLLKYNTRNTKAYLVCCKKSQPAPISFESCVCKKPVYSQTTYEHDESNDLDDMAFDHIYGR